MEENMIKVSEYVYMEVKRESDRTIVYIYDNGEEKLLCDIETNEYLWCNPLYDENYVLVYSRGCMLNQIGVNIEGAYNIKTRELLDLSDEKLKSLLENMFIYKKIFNFDVILSVINYNDLNLVSEEEKKVFRDYLTSGNNVITDEEIVSYILKLYPIFSKYTHLIEPLSVIDYKNISLELEKEVYAFNAIPQNLDFINNIEKEKILKKQL